MRVLVVGNGGREHALVWKIRQSPLVNEVYCAPGNAGIAELADCVPIDTSNIVEVADFAQTIKADLTVVGPELPMVLGIADEFIAPRAARSSAPAAPPPRSRARRPSRASSCSATRSPRRATRSARTVEEAHAFVKKAPFGFPMVLKADGLASGKGTFIAKDARRSQARSSTR